MNILHTNKVLALIMAAAAAVNMTACGSPADNSPAENTPAATEAETTAAAPAGPVALAPSAENVKFLGRTMFTDDMLWLTFSGSGAEFTVNGTSAEVTVSGDDTALKPDNADSQARIAVYLDGKRVVDDMIDAAEETYPVFESDSPEEHTVSIVKLSESANSTCAIKSLTVNGEIKPAGAKKHFIEFIGDSITCGYGVDDEDRDHHFSTTTEDVTKTYAYKTAQKLDADYSMVSASGYGIISGYSDGKKKVVAQQLPKYYGKLGVSYGSKWNGQNPSSVSWDFSGYTPDVIVINLGTNDASYTKNDGDKCEEYAAAYVEFLKEIRSHNPDAHIFCALGIMGDNLYPYIEYAAEMYKEETGDDKITPVHLDVQNQSDGYAADWHPTEATHEKASQKLSDQIKETMGW